MKEICKCTAISHVNSGSSQVPGLLSIREQAVQSKIIEYILEGNLLEKV